MQLYKCAHEKQSDFQKVQKKFRSDSLMDRNFNGQNNFGGMNRQQSIGKQIADFSGGQAPDSIGKQIADFGSGQAPDSIGKQIADFSGGQAPDSISKQISDFDSGQAPRMWGNAAFAGEEIFSGNDNFITGAPTDITEFVDTTTTGGFSEEKSFSNFSQGGLMPQIFGIRGGQFNQQQQPQQNQFK